MSSAELKKVGGTNPRIEAASRELTNLLAGRTNDTRILTSTDPELRFFVAAELLAATADPDDERRQRARRLFVEHGYLDDAIHSLLDADTGKRVAAARILGEFGSDFATPALVAVLLDNDPKVRNAAAAALMQIGEGATQEPTLRLELPHRMLTGFPFPAETESHLPGESVRLTLAEEPAPVASDLSETSDLKAMLLNENTLRQSLEQMEGRLFKTTSALAEIDKEIRLRTEAALKFKSEATTLRQKEAECRTQAETLTSLYQTEIELKAQAEKVRQTLTEEVSQVRIDVERTSEAVLNLSRQTAQVAAARKSEAEEARRQADLIQNVELDRLRSEEASLRQAAEKIAMRRTEVERARQAIEKAASGLLDQPDSAEGSRVAQAERSHQKVVGEIQKMAEAEADARRRIELADLRRRAAEETCRQAEEKALEVEAEAHRLGLQEEQALAKLENTRLAAAADAQARVDEEARIKEETEHLRRLADEAKLRVDVESRRRAKVEARLHKERQHLTAEELHRLKAEREHHLLVERALPQIETDEKA